MGVIDGPDDVVLEETPEYVQGYGDGSDAILKLHGERIMDERVSDILAALYRREYVMIAELCDEYLDRSGKLLGTVRHKAALIPAEKE